MLDKFYKVSMSLDGKGWLPATKTGDDIYTVLCVDGTTVDGFIAIGGSEVQEIVIERSREGAVTVGSAA